MQVMYANRNKYYSSWFNRLYLTIFSNTGLKWENN